MKITKLEDLKEHLEDSIKKAVTLAPKRNFEESVECIMVIRDVDLRHPENRFRLLVKLPNKVAKIDKIGVFADGPHLSQIQSTKIEDAIVEVIDRAKLEVLRSKSRATRKLARKLRIFIASAPLMPIIGKYVAKYLSPLNKMPIPIPLDQNIIDALNDAKHTVAVRLSTSPQIATRIGYKSMKIEQLTENAFTLVSAVVGKLPSGLSNISDIYIKTTMGPPARISLE
ncbi:MAG: 50S ribosomal protein L1 [Crenarchaeota archaeon]|nr:50S ribosomal protein L1 [Thermoproteota archaeon]MCR8453814.1 50S ribosomal protein L1 [Thermoproteota archaeon]MCR8455635.1 50S ribosomal protein L1 [Thermoproteota archaeon]MCR8462637.1 50S ribosomal protein L1 [Thermoproteota archaeon]MCR8470946.1 50S ribosomal protein L1 [Thermoproteota archaeon]